MMLMAIDHIRDYVARSAMQFLPTDLTRTTAAIFLTRWITHFCAPVFMLTAGLGAFFWMSRGRHSKAELSRFLIARGVWLILLEVTILRVMMFSQGSFRGSLVILLILWAIGISMIALAVLIYLPTPVLVAVSVGIIALHNLLDGIPATRFGRAAPFWDILHQQGLFSFAGLRFVTAYPVLPWIGVVAVRLLSRNSFFGGWQKPRAHPGAAGVRAERRVCGGARDQFVWRPFTLEPSTVRAVYGAVIPQYYEVPAFA